MKLIIVALLFGGLLATGCDSDNKKPEAIVKTAEKEAVKNPVPVTNVKETTSTGNELAQRTNEMKTASGNLAKAIQDKTVPMLEKAKNKATDLVETIQDKTEPILEKTKEKTISIAETVKEKSAPVVITTMEKATELTNKAAKTVQNLGNQPPIQRIPKTITLINKKGKITLPHKQHSQRIACSTCHGEKAPAPFTLGKEAGHNLCKGCHKLKKEGPTKCSGCHAKQAVKTPYEGC